MGPAGGTPYVARSAQHSHAPWALHLSSPCGMLKFLSQCARLPLLHWRPNSEATQSEGHGCCQSLRCCIFVTSDVVANSAITWLPPVQIPGIRLPARIDTSIVLITRAWCHHATQLEIVQTRRVRPLARCVNSRCMCVQQHACLSKQTREECTYTAECTYTDARAHIVNKREFAQVETAWRRLALRPQLYWNSAAHLAAPCPPEAPQSSVSARTTGWVLQRSPCTTLPSACSCAAPCRGLTSQPFAGGHHGRWSGDTRQRDCQTERSQG